MLLYELAAYECLLLCMWIEKMDKPIDITVNICTPKTYGMERFYSQQILSKLKIHIENNEAFVVHLSRLALFCQSKSTIIDKKWIKENFDSNMPHE